MVPKRAVFSQFHVFPVMETLRALMKGQAYNSSVPVYLVIKFLAKYLQPRVSSLHLDMNSEDTCSTKTPVST